jgi:hypothetical protein
MLREKLNLTGTKIGWDRGLRRLRGPPERQAVLSCMMLAIEGGG